MPLAGFEPTISGGQRPQTNGLDRAATGTDLYSTIQVYTILHHTIPYHITLHYTALHYTTLHYTTLHNAIIENIITVNTNIYWLSLI